MFSLLPLVMTFTLLLHVIPSPCLTLNSYINSLSLSLSCSSSHAHALLLSLSLSMSCRLVMGLSICQLVALQCDNKSSNQTGRCQLAAQCSTLTNRVTVCVTVCVLVWVVSVYHKSVRISVRKSFCTFLQRGCLTTHVRRTCCISDGVCVYLTCPQNKVGHRFRFISGIISYDSSTGMF